MPSKGGLWRSVFGRYEDSAARPTDRRRCRPEVAPLEERRLLFVTGITAVATPNVLVPPNGRYVPVTVTGTILDSHDKAPQSFFKVTDEYRRDEPFAPLTLQRTAQYTFRYRVTFFLQAQRSTQVPDGRHYDILIAAGDQDGGNGKTIPVLVPRDASQLTHSVKGTVSGASTARRH
jgi:hypothetical protein